MNYEQVIKFFGGENGNITLAARKSGFTKASFHNWKKSKTGIPHSSQCFLQVVSNGKLKADKKDSK